jgi:two-component system alkaline phosphatase synthesis response regulator PhoP
MTTGHHRPAGGDVSLSASATNTARRILVVDDDEDVLDLVGNALSREGYRVTKAIHGQLALDSAKAELPHLVLLDLVLPDMDGIEVCRRLKWDAATRSIPVIMVTGKTDESDVVLGLGLGADDYITKPFRIRELLARVQVALRRLDSMRSSMEPSRESLTVCPQTGRTQIDGNVVPLRPTEQRLMKVLASRPGTTFTRADLVSRACHENEDVNERTIDVHVQSIRKKLGRHGRSVITVRGIGYQLER